MKGVKNGRGSRNQMEKDENAPSKEEKPYDKQITTKKAGSSGKEKTKKREDR